MRLTAHPGQETFGRTCFPQDFHPSPFPDLTLLLTFHPLFGFLCSLSLKSLFCLLAVAQPRVRAAYAFTLLFAGHAMAKDNPRMRAKKQKENWWALPGQCYLFRSTG